MNADFLFETGDSHKVCEDYGRHGKHGDMLYIAQSDGCSDPKSPDTDFGARLLVKSAENFIIMGLPNYGDQAVAAAQAQARSIGLHPNCLDATLIVAMAMPDHRKTQVKMWGDGVVSGKRRDGTVVAYVAVSPKSADGTGSIPYYISYTLDRNRLENYKAAGTPKMAVYEFSAYGKVISCVETDVTPDPATIAFGHDEFEFISTFSDGVESFYYRDTNGAQTSVPVEQVVFPMTNFVGYAGEFVRRQYNIFNRTLAIPNKWKHYDDLSYGAIYHGEVV